MSRLVMKIIIYSVIRNGKLISMTPPSTQQEKRIFTNFHRQLFCTIDDWIELNMDDIRRMEAETKKELEDVSAWVQMTRNSR